MPHPIVLTTLNARYIHCAFGLRYLLANLGPLQAQATMVELGIKQRPMDMAEQLLAHQPRIIGIGVYIWNAEQTLKLVQLLRALAPDVKIVLGGPEVSYEVEDQALTALADVVVTGEADLVFPEVCRRLLAGEPVDHVVAADPPDMTRVRLPYDLYSDHDLAKRVIYVEASRGCPYQCAFCLSSLDIPVRRPDEAAFFAAMDNLLARGARHFKFVDRTFNLNLKLTTAILDFFLARLTDGLFLHFEMVPDRLPEALRTRIAAFPPGMLQLEVGIQTFHPEVAARISLRRDFAKAADNLAYLHTHTGVHVHADLIAGLPGEDLASFAVGFDRLLAMGPHEIQVGILKRLRGTPIVAQTENFAMVYSPFPPYEILANADLDHAALQRVRRFSQVWDRLANSGRFGATLPLLLAGESAFWAHMAFCDWLAERVETVFDVGPDRLGKFLHTYLTEARGLDPADVRAALAHDMDRLGRHLPGWLKDAGTMVASRAADAPARAHAPATGRQTRHRAAG